MERWATHVTLVRRCQQAGWALHAPHKQARLYILDGLAEKMTILQKTPPPRYPGST